ncbi:MAG TPA: hypothetical protein VJP84_01990 [Steroidobacteraceae bacterium]|jgi:hypothetical protein|nr:hypothetical protein [Steroidobacteraceae bacterium]
MTRSIEFLLHRAYEQLVSTAGAVVMTILLLVSVDARAASHGTLKPSVSILVPTVTVLVPSVTIEAIE